MFPTKAGAVVVAVLLGATGCVPPAEFVGSGMLDLERISADDVRIQLVEARQRGSSLSVDGGLSPPSTRGCVEVTVLSPERTVIATKTVPVAPYHHHHRKAPRRTGQNPTFTAELPVAPPKGSLLRLVHREVRAAAATCAEDAGPGRADG